MRARALLFLGGIAVVCGAVLAPGAPTRGEQPGRVLDEARQAGLPPKHFLDHVADEDYFHDMDGASRSRPRRSRAATPGSSGPAATIASGT